MLQQTPPPPYPGPAAKPATTNQEVKPPATAEIKPAPPAPAAPQQSRLPRLRQSHPPRLKLRQFQPPQAAPSKLDAGDELLQIRSVYILHMSRAFDQYLATHLTRGGVLQVVTDPQKADAILTEQLGKNFEDQMEELFPKPKAPAPVAAETDDEQFGSAATRLDMQDPEGKPRSTFGRGRGTVFLVHRSSGNVVWSTYMRPKSPTADVLNDVARQVADQIKDAFKKRQAALLKSANGGK